MICGDMISQIQTCDRTQSRLALQLTVQACRIRSCNRNENTTALVVPDMLDGKANE